MQILALLLGNCFNDIIALLGSIGFAPLTVYFPVSHHILAVRFHKNCTLKRLSVYTASPVPMPEAM